jgi:hypothetical protein
LSKPLEAFSVGSAWLKGSAGLRLDASFYNPRSARAIDTLKHSGLTLKTLGEVTERIFIPGRFARTYVDKDHGLPFLQGSHVVHFQPADLKYVSPTVHKKLELWVIREGWLLVTRSGSVGRIAVTPHSWNGWAASEHSLRIVPKKNGPCPVGYLYAFLSSELGQAQLTAQIYGAVVDELTEDQTRSVLIPVPETPEQVSLVEQLSAVAMQSVQMRSEAVRLAEQAVAGIDDLVPAGPLPEAEEPREYDGSKPSRARS